MIDWKEFWTSYPTSIGEQNFLRQVGHTVDGRPYGEAEFDAMIASIRKALALRPGDVLLDVCCGNGIVTQRLAGYCHKVVGVDFSGPLVEIARKYHGGGNLQYRVMNALEIDNGLSEDRRFTRILMYAALQHFQPDDLRPLLEGFRRHGSADAVIVLGGVLDAARQQKFLDSPEKQAMYQKYKHEGRDRLGTWWDTEMVRATCAGLGLNCSIDNTSPGRPGGHYRFDARIF